jgi:subtilase-type serine protease
MKTREILILLRAAAFGAIAIVTWNGEEEAKSLTAKAVAELTQTKADAAKAAAAHKAAQDKAAADLAKAKADADAASKQAEAALAKAKDDAVKATAELKADLIKAKDAAAKAAMKATELEKAKAAADARVNELNAELANLRNGSELKEAIAQRKKAEADLEAASAALREANAKLAAALARIAELEEENRRLRDQPRGTPNTSPNYRVL